MKYGWVEVTDCQRDDLHRLGQKSFSPNYS
jgi:hypothetical protein